MKLIYRLFSVTLLLGLCVACSKERVQDNGNGGGVPEEILPMTKEMNALSGALVASDAENDYFQYPEGDRVALCKRNRKSGVRTVLAERPWDAASEADVTFTDLCLKDNYLYFTLFDLQGGIKYALCRVPVDASSEYETVREFGWDYEGFHFDRDHTYMEVESDGGSSLEILDYATGTLSGGYPLPADFTPKFIYEGYLYGTAYATTDGKLHVQIYRCAAGSTEAELVWSDPGQQSLLFLASDSRLYIADPNGGRLFGADLDGKNAGVLLENVRILKMNLHKGAMYLLVDSGSAHNPGLYRYLPGEDGLTVLYQSGGILFGPFITGTGDIWFSAASDDTSYRLGKLQYLDSDYRHHRI